MEMTENHIKAVLAMNENTSWGQKTTSVAVEYDTPVASESVSAACFKVRGRTVTDAKAVDCFGGRRGHFVLLTLDPADRAALTRKLVGFGPDTKTEVTGTTAAVCQCTSIRAANGGIISEIPAEMNVTAEISPIVDDFIQAEFHTVYGRTLPYNLYIPRNLESGKEYPLVVFLHDSSACSDSVNATLLQGMGALVWAVSEEQEKRPCFVLAPQYTEKAAFDDYTTTWHADATAELIKALCNQYAVDENRIYGTGQSMGCMMLCDLIVRYPELFTACYLVAGQWSPDKMAAHVNARLWILVSEKDEKAYPTMRETVEKLESAGAKVACGHIDAKAGIADQRAFADAVLADEAGIQFTWYEGDSDLPEGMSPFPGCYHLCTWLWAYGMEPIREWLFRQSK